MRSTLVVAVVVGLILSACAPAGQASGTPEASTRPATEATASPLSTATQVPTTEPTPEATPSPFGAAVFSDPDDCTNPAAGYRVAYPDAWYSNGAVANPSDQAGEGIPACKYFAPRDFAVVYGTEPSPDIAISMAIFELPDGVKWDYGPYERYEVVSDTPVTIGGYPARVQEVEVTVPTIGFTAKGDRYTEYIVELGENRYLSARTRNNQDYRASRQVLADMIQTLQVLSR